MSRKKLDNNFLYWLIGAALIIRHPIMRPIDLAKSMEVLLEMREDKLL